MRLSNVIGFEGLYMVSDTGIVFTNYNKNGKRGQALKCRKDKDGYLEVRLYKNGKGFHKKIHRLVAEAFIPNIENKPCVNHLDCNRTNNNVENLEWCTENENVQYAAKLGRYKGSCCKKICAIDKYGTRVIYESMQEASRITNVPAPNIHKCCTGKRKTAGGFQWKYYIEQE